MPALPLRRGEVAARSALRSFPALVVGASLLTALVAAAALVVADADLSPTAEVRNDLIFRAARTDPPLTYRSDDPTPWVAFLPADIFIHRALRAGELPVWNPHPGGGESPVRRFQLAVFHPLRLLSVLVPERQAQSFTLLLALALAFAGAVLVAVRFGASRQAAVVGAVTFAFSAYLLATLQMEFPLVVCHLPWLVLALDVLVQAPRLRARDVVVAGVVVALLVASGHPGVEVSMCAFAIVVAGARALSTGALRHAWRMAPAGAIGVALSAPVWAPFLGELASAWCYKYESGFGVLYAPIAWRYWPDMVASIVGVGDPGTYADFISAYAWLGPLVTALAVLGAVVAARHRERWRALVLAVAFAFAVPGPWMAWCRHVPGLWTIKPWYLYGCLPFAVSLCVARAWDAVVARAPFLARPAAAGAVAFVLATSTMARMALWVTPDRGAFPPQSAVLDALRAQPGPVRITAPAGQAHLPELSSITGIDDIRTVGATLSRRYHRWFELVDPDVLSRAYPSTRMSPFVDGALMRSFAVGYALEPRASGANEWTAPLRAVPDDVRRIEPRGPLSLVVDDGWVRLWQIPNARARAGAARALVLVDGPDDAVRALRSLGDDGIDRHDVVETAGLDPATRAGLAALAAGPAAPPAVTVRRFARPTGRSLALDVDAAGPTLLVVQELYEDGWSARVDGASAPLVPVNLVARGVLVPAGAHRVEMSYLPPLLLCGCALSAAALAACAILLARARRRMR